MARMRYIRNLMANKAAIQVPFKCNDYVEPMACDYEVIFDWKESAEPKLLTIECVKELERIDSTASLKDETCCSTDQNETNFSSIRFLADLVM